MNKNLYFIICASGIFVFFFYQGILMEEITSDSYGDHINENGETGERFKFALTLVFIQCVSNFTFARIIICIRPRDEDKTPEFYYASSALMYLGAMITSTMSLQWVSYPTQVIGKAAKPIPIMLLGVLIGHKKYRKFKYFCVMLIVLGIALFMYKDGSSSSNVNSSFGIGEILLMASLLMDGLLGALQDLIRDYKPSSEVSEASETHSPPSGVNMMSSINGWSANYLAFILLFCDEGKQFIRFSVCYPQIIEQLAILAVTGAVGQLFIYMTISKFGSLACSIVTTTRKFFTVLFSVIFFANSLNIFQWVGAAIVFTGLFLDIIYGKIPMKSCIGYKKLDDK